MITNGDFEQIGSIVIPLNIEHAVISDMFAPVLPGWHIIGAIDLYKFNRNPGAPIIGGLYSVNLGDDNSTTFLIGGLYQDFQSSAGVQYDLSYQYQGWEAFFSPGFPTLSVTVTDLPTTTSILTIDSSWTSDILSEQGTFTGTGGMLRLQVNQTGEPVDRGFMVDNFSIVAVAVPEPSGLLLVSGTMMALWLAAKRRRSKTPELDDLVSQ